MIDELLSQVLRTVALDEVLGHVARISEYDRYQASLGLEQAAQAVADAAQAAGLSEVGVAHHAANGQAQWWTFAAPVSWTPLTARLIILDSSGAAVLELDHADAPFSVATYSAPTRPGGTLAPLVRVVGTEVIGDRVHGAVAVVDKTAFLRGSLLTELTEAGALGLVTDAPWKSGDDLPRRGRIELPPRSTLFGFSLIPEQFRLALEAAEHGGSAHTEITVDRSAAMPVVSAVIPGDVPDEDEIWLTGHLCHPRPGSNDNASGVAAVLGVADTLSRLRRADARYGTRRSIRFFWGPEFLGNAAVLHERSTSGLPMPGALINLDMVGEDQSLCRSPFVVERPPDTVETLLGPLAEHIVERTFRATADSPGVWSPSPFLGFSDHALYADPSIGTPAVQFCHPADRFNHSAADSPDKVSPVEMLRTTAAGATLAQVLAAGGPDQAESASIVEHWCVREQEQAERVARDHPAVWGRALLAHVHDRNEILRALASGTQPKRSPAPSRTGGGRVVSACWDGPLNLRAMLGALSTPSRARLAGMIAEDKQHLSVLFNLAIRADGLRQRDAIVAQASFGLRRPLDPDDTAQLFGALLESGWLAEH